ncbi:hypothetical protein KSP39_PZI011513 [Platanthera zijinensis]|uniref:Uncharacterized protein n=1 Tax=Platanthera zijinensis TaxID=2320716 RepID=A0AAP0BHB6_9ASPA
MDMHTSIIGTVQAAVEERRGQTFNGMSSVSALVKMLQESKLGWPLLWRAMTANVEASKEWDARKILVLCKYPSPFLLFYQNKTGCSQIRGKGTAVDGNQLIIRFLNGDAAGLSIMKETAPSRESASPPRVWGGVVIIWSAWLTVAFVCLNAVDCCLLVLWSRAVNSGLKPKLPSRPSKA